MIKPPRYTVSFILLFAFATNWLIAQEKYPTKEIETYYDLTFTKAERDTLLSGLQDYQKSIQAIHQ